MSESGDKRHRKKGRGHPAAKPPNDLAIYIGVLMIGAFGVFLITLVTQGAWREAVAGYLLAVLGIINWSGWSAFLGRTLQPWQQAFARIPLRFAGFAGAHAKPITAAKHHPAARNTMFITALISLVLVIAITALLLNQTTP